MNLNFRTVLQSIDIPKPATHFPQMFLHDTRSSASARAKGIIQTLFLAGSLLLCTNGALAGTDWPAFRGPFADGRVSASGDTRPVGLPITWSETENVKWKTAIHDQGWSTPAIMDGQIWLTTATVDGHDFFVLCLDATTGQIKFEEKLFHWDNPEPLGNARGVNCYATPSPAIEPGRVYVHFGSFGTACLDSSAFKVLWKREDLPCRHYRGPSSSPVLFEDLLILTFDGADKQYVTALDKQTGKTVWKTDRSVAWNDENSSDPMTKDGDRRKAHSTPILINASGKPQLLSGGAKAAYGYDPRTGKEIWRAAYDAWSAAPLPLFDNGLAFFVTGYGTTELWALKVDGQGDVAGSKVVWKFGSMVPKAASPVLVDGMVYMVSDDGAITCLEAATGKQVWRQRIGGKFWASPIYADGRIYFSSEQGKTTVVKAGPTYEGVATNSLPGGFMASPAVSGNALLLRTKTHLYRIESGATPTP
jgi:outer membrane protein assembly factor BamB